MTQLAAATQTEARSDSKAALSASSKLRVRTGAAVRTLDVAEGATLLQIALEADTGLTFVCCRAVCGECLIRVSADAHNLSPKTTAEKTLLTALSAPSDARLACQCSVLGDVEIELIEDSILS